MHKNEEKNINMTMQANVENNVNMTEVEKKFEKIQKGLLIAIATQLLWIIFWVTSSVMPNIIQEIIFVLAIIGDVAAYILGGGLLEAFKSSLNFSVKIGKIVLGVIILPLNIIFACMLVPLLIVWIPISFVFIPFFIVFGNYRRAKKELESLGGKPSALNFKDAVDPIARAMGERTDNINVSVIPKKVYILGGGAAVLLIAAILIIPRMGSATVDLNKFLVIETEGIDGYGTAVASVDWEGISEKYGSKIKLSSKAKKQLGAEQTMAEAVELLQYCVNVQLERETGLSNGTEISYKWNIDEESLKYLNCKLKYTDGKYTVSGLSDVGTFDAFADLKVEFSGIAPNGGVRLEYSGSELSQYEFTCDKTSGLSNGDKVKITLDESTIEYCANKYGKAPKELEKEYIVEGLESYITRIAEINESALSEMKSQASDVFNSKVVSRFGEGENLESFDYMGDYLLTSKKSDSWGDINYLFLIYKAQIHHSYSKNDYDYDKINEFYWFIRFRNLKIGAENKVIVDVASYNVPSSSIRFENDSASFLTRKSWYYNGYESMDELYKDAVTSKIDLFNVESGEDEQNSEGIDEESVVKADSELSSNLPEGYLAICNESGEYGWGELKEVSKNDDGSYTAIWSYISDQKEISVTDEEFESLKKGAKLPESVTSTDNYLGSLQCIEASEKEKFVSYSDYASVEEALAEGGDVVRLSTDERDERGNIKIMITDLDHGVSGYKPYYYDANNSGGETKTIISQDAEIDYIEKMKSGSSGDMKIESRNKLDFKEFVENGYESDYERYTSEAGLGTNGTWRRTGTFEVHGDSEGRIISLKEIMYIE